MTKWLNFIFALLIIVFSWFGGATWITWTNTVLAILIIIFSLWQPKQAPTTGPTPPRPTV